jgi:uncharacterized protein
MAIKVAKIRSKAYYAFAPAQTPVEVLKCSIKSIFAFEFMEAQISKLWHGEELVFLKEKALWLPGHQSLLMSDVHLGKMEHFRKHGIAAPVHQEECSVMDTLIQALCPQKIYFLGDLFHSDPNQAVIHFKDWRSRWKHLDMMLIKGNHDIFPDTTYKDLGLDVTEQSKIGSISLLHESQQPEGLPVISGHLHPGVQLVGSGRQRLKYPCFYLKPDHLILPAFGSTTGLYIIQPSIKAEVVVVTPTGLLSFVG